MSRLNYATLSYKSKVARERRGDHIPLDIPPKNSYVKYMNRWCIKCYKTDVSAGDTITVQLKSGKFTLVKLGILVHSEQDIRIFTCQ